MDKLFNDLEKTFNEIFGNINNFKLNNLNSIIKKIILLLEKKKIII